MVSPDGLSLYVTGEAAVTQYTIGVGGTLTPKSPASVPAGRNPVGIAVSPDGKTVYAANNGDNTISQYTVGKGGRLTPKSQRTVPAAGGPWEIAVLAVSGS